MKFLWLFYLGSGLLLAADETKVSQPKNDQLRQELLERMQVDQEARKAFMIRMAKQTGKSSDQARDSDDPVVHRLPGAIGTNTTS